ncbi:helix-turn-helix transcriptional regulator [Streptomyces beihaiensis]|uniref:AAA family ATPase n=1 Tax=Streptomyces beihaiensis TaxID=2984495 RepID=A0ABT3TX98_9ACTN|nr:LuxR family transcriptional regulator [Streptomyces beihaiensis]MCX3061673.1 AAA family ATPase [Streptomyces beihaiensis]
MTDRVRPRATDLVGRDAEADALHDALDDARRSRGTAVFVVGEPGIGKTRLVTETADRALESGMVVLKGRCTATGPFVPYRPLSEALLSLARTLEEPPAELGPYLPVLGRLVPEWWTGEGVDRSPVVLAEAVLRLASAQGRGRGCLLVVDDLHDADPETLAIIEYIAANLAHQPVAVVATVRSAACAASELANAVVQRREGRLVPIGRLCEPDTHRLAAACLGCRPEELPVEVSRRVFADSSGIPFVAEELIRSMRTARELLCQDGRWRLAGSPRSRVPFTLVRAIEQRAARLGPGGARMLSAAAVLGRGFPLSVVQRCTDLDDSTLLSCLRSAVADGLLVPDERGPDWYTFEHPLAEEALLAGLTPVDRAALSRRAADAVEELHPELPGTWCHLAARLRRQGGDPPAAAQLYLEVARRALAGSGPGTAIALLDEARQTLGEESEASTHRGLRRELLETLLFALADDGQFDRALQVADGLRQIDVEGETTRQVELHVRLARAAEVAGRWDEGLRQVELARALVPRDADVRQTAGIDAVEAFLVVSQPVHGCVGRSEELARRAIEGAERRGDPALACQAWYAVGFASRRRSLSESDECFRRTLRIATDSDLMIWRNHGLIGLGNNAWLAEATTDVLVHAHKEALRTGCVSLAHNAGAMLAFDAVLRSQFDRAATLLDGALEETGRLKLHSVSRYLLMLRAVLAAHQGKRAQMRATLAEFRAQGGERSREAPLARGLAELFCALLTEDPNSADIAADLSAAQPGQETFFHLSGPHGLILLLGTLDGRAGWAEHDRVSAGQAGRMRWNRQFVGLSKAVLLGREGRAEEAQTALDAAMRSAEVFPTARHLGLRLVADAALEGGWGQPYRWLTEAEDYFYRTGATTVADACRARLRRLGVLLRQRRVGTDQIPPRLRAAGVTSREFDVFRLLEGRLGNKALADRLHISARTVEKHVASLLAKTGAGDRARLCDYAADVMAGLNAG